MVDCDVQVFEISSEAEIIRDVLQPDGDETDDDESEEIAPLPSLNDVRQAVRTLHLYLEGCEGAVALYIQLFLDHS